MSSYVKGVLAALVEPVVHGWANIIDSHLSNNVFPRISILLLSGAIINIILLPLIILVSPVHALSPLQASFVFFIALVEMLYIFPYFWSLRTIDTSVVTSLFTFSDVLVPFLAFIFLKETLAFSQYIGFFIVIFSAIGLTIDPKKIEFNRAFIYMFLVGIMLAGRSVLLKYVFDTGATWGSFMVYLAIFQLIIASAFALHAGRDEIRMGFSSLYKIKGLYAADEFLSWLGNAGNSFALSLLSVPIVQGIGATQPAFVLITALLLKKQNPGFFKEAIDKKTMGRKILFFVLTIVGVVLVVK